MDLSVCHKQIEEKWRQQIIVAAEHEFSNIDNFSDIMFNAFYRRTSHESNRIQVRKIICSPSLAFDSAYTKYGARTGHEIFLVDLNKLLAYQ